MESAGEADTARERFNDRFEIVIAIALGLAAILAALCVYLEDIHNDNAEVGFNNGVRQVTEATGEFVSGSQQRAADEASLIQFIVANYQKRYGLANDLRTSVFRDDLQAAVNWWRRNAGVGPTPFTAENPHWIQPQIERGTELTAAANATFAEAKSEQDEGDRFIIAGVIVATALFLYGLAAVVKSPRLKVILATFGASVFLLSLGVVLTGL